MVLAIIQLIGQVVTTLYETVLANPNFTWEKANNYNIGLDATVLNNKIDLTIEYFIISATRSLFKKLDPLHHHQE